MATFVKSQIRYIHYKLYSHSTNKTCEEAMLKFEIQLFELNETQHNFQHIDFRWKSHYLFKISDDVGKYSCWLLRLFYTLTSSLRT